MQLEGVPMDTIVRQEQMFTPWNVQRVLSAPLEVQLPVSAPRAIFRMKQISQIATFVPLATTVCRIPPIQKIVHRAVTAPRVPDLQQNSCALSVLIVTSLTSPLSRIARHVLRATTVLPRV